MSELSHTKELEKRHLQKELDSTILVVKELETKINEISKKFSDGIFNSRASFREAANEIDRMKQLIIEQKKHEKNCTKLREKLKQF